MLIRIALVAPLGEAQQRLRARLSQPLSYVVREFQSLDEVQSGLAQFSFQILVVRLPTFQVGHQLMVTKLRSCYPTASLVTISPSIAPQARYAVKGLANHALLDEELELGDLDDVIHKLCKPTLNLEFARLHPRVRRDGVAFLVVRTGHGDIRLPAKFVDFARMGAKLKLEGEIPHELFLPKAKVELHYRSSEDAERVHRLESRVAWASRTDALFKKTKAEIGLRFVAEL